MTTDEVRYYILDAMGCSRDIRTEDEALSQACYNERQGPLPVSIACVEDGLGRIVYTGQALAVALDKWRNQHQHVSF
jgi:hypothetical protein